MAAVKEKDEWRFATMEYGGQCVTMAGMKWMQMLSVLSLGMDIQVSVICQQSLIILGLNLSRCTSNQLSSRGRSNIIC